MGWLKITKSDLILLSVSLIEVKYGHRTIDNRSESSILIIISKGKKWWRKLLHSWFLSLESHWTNIINYGESEFGLSLFSNREIQYVICILVRKEFQMSKRKQTFFRSILHSNQPIFMVQDFHDHFSMGIVDCEIQRIMTLMV